MKAYCGGGIAQLVHNLGIRKKHVAILAPRSDHSTRITY